MMGKLGKYSVTEQDNGVLRVEGESISTKEINAPQGDLLTVNGAWYINALPNMVVIERVDGSLGMYHLTPFRAIKDTDIRDYKGYHPRKCKGSPLPEYLYRFYGLVRSGETMSEVVRVRLSPTEKEQLDTAAKNEGKTISEYLRDHIRIL